MSVEERLEFAGKFATMDLATLRRGDWLNLRDDLTHFIGASMTSLTGPTALADLEDRTVPTMIRGLSEKGRAATMIYADPFTQGKVSEDAIRKIQSETWRILKSVSHVIGTDTEKTFQLPNIRLTVELTPSRTPLGMVLLGGGLHRDVFLFSLLFLLATQSVNRLLTCPECSRIFFRKRRQKYCSRDCTNRVSVRRWREKNRAKKRPMKEGKKKTRGE